eukprot:9489193-Pyramimonas_sp.AAC.1
MDQSDLVQRPECAESPPPARPQVVAESRAAACCVPVPLCFCHATVHPSARSMTLLSRSGRYVKRAMHGTKMLGAVELSKAY